MADAVVTAAYTVGDCTNKEFRRPPEPVTPRPSASPRPRTAFPPRMCEVLYLGSDRRGLESTALLNDPAKGTTQ